MLKTKLILIDGITGSGKSTIAHFISRQLNKNQILNKWFPEEDPNNPLRFSYNPELKLNLQERKSLFIKEYPLLWKELSERIAKNPEIIIIESYIFQFILAHLLSAGAEQSELNEFYDHIYKFIAPLNPIIINFYQNDVKQSLDLNWKRRGEEWKTWHVSRFASSSIAKARNLSGEEFAYEHYQRQSDIALEILSTLNCPKLLIENSKQDWDLYRKTITDFLQITYFEEVKLRSSDEKYCGIYSTTFDEQEVNHKVYIENERLCIDAFWPGLKLLPVSENRFNLEGYEFYYTFNTDTEGKVISFTFQNERETSECFEMLKI